MATPIRGEFNFTWSNDGMNFFVPAAHLNRDRTFYDDDGFTNGLAASLDLSKKENHFGFFLQHRMITERGGLQRADEVQALARVKKTIPLTKADDLQLQAGLGAMLTGPLAGDTLQDAFHRLIQWGRTLNGDIQGQLQNQYDGGVKVAPRLEVGARYRRKMERADHFTAGAQLAFSPNVGATALQVSVGLDHSWKVKGGELQVFSQLPLRYLHAEEGRLTFNGAYPESSMFLQPTGGVSYQYDSLKFGFALMLNYEGTGAHSGALSFSYLFGEPG